MAKWPKHFISGKQFQKRPNLADLAFFKGQMATQYCFLFNLVGELIKQGSQTVFAPPVPSSQTVPK